MNKCKGCFYPKNPIDLTQDNLEKIINTFSTYKPDITISGGEPFLYKNLPNALETISEKLDKPGVFTSGIYKLINFNLESIIDNVKFFNLSMKFPKWSLNDRFFGTKGISQSAKQFIEDVREYKIPINIQFAVDRRNIKYFDLMYRFAFEFDCELHIIRYLPFAGDYNFALNDEEWEGLVNKVYDKEGISIMFPSSKTYKNCVAGLTRLSIHPNGDISPCIYLAQERVVNLFDQEICVDCDIPVTEGVCHVCGGKTTYRRDLNAKEVMNIMYGWRSCFPDECCIAQQFIYH